MRNILPVIFCILITLTVALEAGSKTPELSLKRQLNFTVIIPEKSVTAMKNAGDSFYDATGPVVTATIKDGEDIVYTTTWRNFILDRRTGNYRITRAYAYAPATTKPLTLSLIQKTRKGMFRTDVTITTAMLSGRPGTVTIDDYISENSDIATDQKTKEYIITGRISADALAAMKKEGDTLRWTTPEAFYTVISNGKKISEGSFHLRKTSGNSRYPYAGESKRINIPLLPGTYTIESHIITKKEGRILSEQTLTPGSDGSGKIALDFSGYYSKDFLKTTEKGADLVASSYTVRAEIPYSTVQRMRDAGDDFILEKGVLFGKYTITDYNKRILAEGKITLAAQTGALRISFPYSGKTTEQKIMHVKMGNYITITVPTKNGSLSGKSGVGTCTKDYLDFHVFIGDYNRSRTAGNEMKTYTMPVGVRISKGAVKAMKSNGDTFPAARAEITLYIYSAGDNTLRLEKKLSAYFNSRTGEYLASISPVPRLQLPDENIIIKATAGTRRGKITGIFKGSVNRIVRDGNFILTDYEK